MGTFKHLLYAKKDAYDAEEAKALTLGRRAIKIGLIPASRLQCDSV